MREYNESLIKAFKLSEQISAKTSSKNVNLYHLFISIIETNKEIKKIAKKFKINKKDFISLENSNKKDYKYYNKEIKYLLEQVNYNNQDSNKLIDEYDILNEILSNDNNEVYKTLIRNSIDIEDFRNSINKIETISSTTLLDSIAVNLNEEAKSGKFDQIYIREKEINRIIEILARKNKNNPLLIGEAGVGKTAIVEELARRIVTNTAPPFLKNKIIYSMNISNLIAGTKYRGEFEEKLNKIIYELSHNSNIILFIDEIHTIIGAGGAEGAIDASNIFKPALARNQIKVIGATTIKEYKQSIENDKALDRRFQKVYISSPTLSETKHILLKIKKNFEKYHNVKINDEIIDNIVTLSNKYIHDRNEPDRSIDILDEVCVKANIKSQNEDLFELNNLYNKTIEKKNKLIKLKRFSEAKMLKDKENNLRKKIKSILNNSSKRVIALDDLEKVIKEKSNQHIIEFDSDINFISKNKIKVKKKIIGQDKQIDKIFEIINIEKLNGTVIELVGNKNVGKTSTVKLISKLFMKNLIELNMNEFNNEMSINRIIGSTQGYVGYDDRNTIFENVKIYPDSIILIKNLNNASKNVYNLLVDIIENKALTLSSGEKINFSNCSFFLINKVENNSNIGFINNSKDYESKISNYVIKFNNLTKKDIKKIITNELKEYYKKNNISYKLNNNDFDYLINTSNFNKEGNNKIQNIIKNYLYNKIN